MCFDGKLRKESLALFLKYLEYFSISVLLLEIDCRGLLPHRKSFLQ